MRMNSLIATLVVAGSAASVLADTVQMRFVGTGPGENGNVTVASIGGAFNTFAGAFRHEFAGPATGLGSALVGQTLQTYCIELEPVNNQFQPCEIEDVADAPNDAPGNPNFNGPYGALREARVHAVIGAAFLAGWIDSRMQLTASAQQAGRGAAIQLLVWESLFEPGSAAAPSGWNLGAGNFVVNSGFSTGLGLANGLIASVNTLFSANYVFGGLRAVTGATNAQGGHTNIQDQLVVVPLPPAAWAGLGTLSAVFGLSYIRRRRLAAAN